ncbi:substrate-binding domain-containing protein [Paenibacillus kobensis]|uniref:substrate-binding domain-containing protein n=1 Tax=Paenibacillus kobensis TaxID=59841 RepID=UPI000FDA6C45|nr:substrate-binding domain-containing protein [Paenibacillus kobensis]
MGNKIIRTYRKKGCFIAAVGLLCVSVLTACSSASLSNTATVEAAPKRIAFVAPIHAGQQGNAMKLGADAAAKEFGAQLVYIPFEQNEKAAAQRDAALAIIDSGVSAVLIDPADNEVLTEIAAKASEHHTPLFALNDETETKGVSGTISVDNTEAGREAGEAMAELLGGSGKVVIIGKEGNSIDQLQREAGIREKLKQAPNIEVAYNITCAPIRILCWQATKKLLDEAHVDGIIPLDAESSLGVADELIHRGGTNLPAIVTFGSEQEQLEMLQDGVIQTLVVQSGFSTGYLGVKQAVDLMSGNKPDKAIVLDTTVITADNMFWMGNQKMLFPFVQ